LGVAFKEETDDIRESVSLSIIDRLVNYYGNSVSITVHDPKACANFNSYTTTKSRNKAWESIVVHHDMQQSIKTSDYDVLIVATRWEQFVSNHHLEESIKSKKSVFMYDLHNIVRFSKPKNDIFDSEQKRLFLLGQNLLNN
jgi:UDP-glucose 6-dehydrogenase